MMKAKDINEQITWEKITRGAAIFEGSTSIQVQTGDWATHVPKWLQDKCTQCLLCVPVCPDISIPMLSNKTRGAYDYMHCKGCGICAKQCPFNAIIMVEKEEVYE